MAGEAERKTPQVYTLTQLTRAAGQSRRIVIAGFDLPLRGLIIAVAAVVASLIPTIILWMFIGQMSLVLPVLFIGAGFYFVESRSRSGLHLRTYQVMADKRRANIGKFVCCGKEVDPSMSGFGQILQSSMPSPYLPDKDREMRGLFAADLADEPDSGQMRAADGTATADGQPALAGTGRARPKRHRHRGRGGDPFAQLMQGNRSQEGDMP